MLHNRTKTIHKIAKSSTLQPKPQKQFLATHSEGKHNGLIDVLLNKISSYHKLRRVSASVSSVPEKQWLEFTIFSFPYKPSEAATCA